jgi:multidrug resistance protein MdtO
VTVFLSFYLLKTLTYFPLATGVVVVATSTMVIWYLPGPAERNVELTLWQILATAIGALVTLLVEVVFRYFAPRDLVREGLTARLQSVEEMLTAYGRQPSDLTTVAGPIEQFALSGASMLRQQIARTTHSPFDRSRMNTMIALVGRTIDVCAAIVSLAKERAQEPREWLESLAARVRAVRDAIQSGGSFTRAKSFERADKSPGLFSDLEATITSMESVMATTSAALPVETPTESGIAVRLFVNDAFSNPEYLRFALAGTAASMLCYVIYSGLHWPGISTAVTTCALTALSDIGSSRQKQLLRISGAAIGGFVFGLGSQVFILPYIDSIVGLTLLFSCVTALSAYVATSSPRLSYAGLQMAFAFYLINVTDFSISLDLTIGRDRAIGVLLGVAAMWLVFERLYPRPAAIQMVKLLARSARLMASLPGAASTQLEIARIRALRESIGASFAGVNAEADAVLFESGAKRPAYLAGRDRVRHWLSTLRTLYLLKLPLLPLGGATEESAQTSLAKRQPEDRSFEHWTAPLLRIAESLDGQVGDRAHAHAGESKPRNQNVSGPADDAQVAQAISESWRLLRDLERDVLREPVFVLPPGRSRT